MGNLVYFINVVKSEIHQPEVNKSNLIESMFFLFCYISLFYNLITIKRLLPVLIVLSYILHFIVLNIVLNIFIRFSYWLKWNLMTILNVRTDYKYHSISSLVPSEQS